MQTSPRLSVQIFFFYTEQFYGVYVFYCLNVSLGLLLCYVQKLPKRKTELLQHTCWEIGNVR